MRATQIAVAAHGRVVGHSVATPTEVLTIASEGQIRLSGHLLCSTRVRCVCGRVICSIRPADLTVRFVMCAHLRVKWLRSFPHRSAPRWRPKVHPREHRSAQRNPPSNVGCAHRRALANCEFDQGTQTDARRESTGVVAFGFSQPFKVRRRRPSNDDFIIRPIRRSGSPYG